MTNIFTFIFIYLSLIKLSTERLIELDDRIVEFSKQGKWLLKFYAPWCGHCKRLEPIFEEVAKHFENTDINVARIDATRFAKAASSFEIKGYPTIKYISPSGSYNFNGDRKLNDLIEFVEKADGPRIRLISSRSDYLKAKSKYKIFFLLIATNNDETTSQLVKHFKVLANEYFLEAYFFVCYNNEVLSKDFSISTLPSVMVVKEEDYFNYGAANNDDTSYKLEQFIKNEQFLTFTYLSLTNFHNLIDTKKILLILNVNDKNDSLSKRLMQTFKSYSESYRSFYYSDFQFAYTDNNELLSGIAIWSLQVPVLFIFNTTNYKYSLIYFNENNIPHESDIDEILRDIREFKMEFYGGEGWVRQIRRPFWELYRAIAEMFKEAPIISLFIFGLPLAVISIVCYFLCCLETTEQNEYEPLSDSDDDREDVDEQDEEGDDKQEPNDVMEDKKTI